MRGCLYGDFAQVLQLLVVEVSKTRFSVNAKVNISSVTMSITLVFDCCYAVTFNDNIKAGFLISSTVNIEDFDSRKP